MSGEHKRIRACATADRKAICAIINDAAEAYRGIIPADRWHDPYMSLADLDAEIAVDVRFFGYGRDGALLGVMGTQAVKDVTLIRHAYVRTATRRQGIGAQLLAHLRTLSDRPVLIGTWAAAVWAVAFYEKFGFRRVGEAEKNRLLATYWSIPERQIETSVVLADAAWFNRER